MGGSLNFVKSNMASITYLAYSSSPRRDTDATMAATARILEDKGVMLIYRRLWHPSFPLLKEMYLNFIENIIF